MDDFTPPRKKIHSPLGYSKRKQPKYQLQNWTHFHIIYKIAPIVAGPEPGLAETAPSFNNGPVWIRID